MSDRVVSKTGKTIREIKGRGGITQKQLATLAGVNPTTIYNSLYRKELVHEETRQQIYELMKKYDYTPNGIARAMVRGKTDVLGIVVPTTEVMFYAKLISAIERFLSGAGYNAIICQHQDDLHKEERELRLMRERRVDGLIIRASGLRSDGETYRRAVEGKIPFVLIDRVLEGLEEYHVGADNVDCGIKAVDYLVSKGHKRIAVVTWTCGHNPRYEGTKAGFEKNSLSFDKDSVVVCKHEYQSEEDEIAAMLESKGAARPTAIIGLNDPMAAGALKAATRLGLRVPDDIAIVSIGGYMDTSLLPMRFTTVELPLATIAHYAVDMVLGEINKKPYRRGPILVKGDVVEGESA